jgi:outer membrane protein assembly factor BamB
MKVGRKQIALLISLFIFSLVAVHVNSDQTKFKESRIIALPPEAILDERCSPVLAVNGKVGFITSVTTGSVMSFNTTSGRIMSSIIVGETAGAISLVETDSRRLLAVPTANDPDHDRPANISIVDATKPKELQIVTLIILPKTAHITPSTPVFLTADARLGIIASSFPEPTLYSFNAETGQIISQLAIIGRPSEIAMRNLGKNNLIAIASAAANSLSFINLDFNGLLTQTSFFSPEKARIDESNNPVISINGRIAYIAASEGGILFSVDTVTGELINSLKVSSVPQRISLARTQNREELIALTLARASASNQAGGVLIVVSSRGQLKVKSNFEPPEQIEFSKVNNVVFSDDATRAFVGSKSGVLFAFNTETGELQSYQSLGSELLSIITNSTVQKIIIIKRNANHDEIVITDFEIVLGGETGDEHIKSYFQNAQSFATDSGQKLEIASNNLLEKRIDSVNSPKVFMQDARGEQIAVESSRVRFRTSKTLEIALDGKLTELIERGGWKFNVRNDQPNDVNSKNQPIPTQINPALSMAMVESIKVKPMVNSVQVVLKTNAQVSYSDFTLSNPSRIVVDVKNVQTTFTHKSLKVNSPSLVSRVRIGQPAKGIVRIVLDSVKNTPYKINSDGETLSITTGQGAIIKE